ncbi:hypothetical protein J2783_003088 [Chryseobacterium sediminis]|nr:hypothetical protein [Chryseobacterium sediminis]
MLKVVGCRIISNRAKIVFIPTSCYISFKYNGGNGNELINTEFAAKPVYKPLCWFISLIGR